METKINLKRKIVFLLWTLMFSVNVFSQRVIEVPEVRINTAAKIPVELDTGCVVNNTMPINTDDEYYYFLLKGINLAKYDWSIPTLNCHINSAYDYRVKQVTNYAWGVGCVCVGATLVLAPLIISRLQEEGATTAMIIPGVALSGISIPLFSASSKHKKRSQEYMFRTMQIINALNKK